MSDVISVQGEQESMNFRVREDSEGHLVESMKVLFHVYFAYPTLTRSR